MHFRVYKKIVNCWFESIILGGFCTFECTKLTFMDILIQFQDNLLRAVNNNFRRYLHPNINWNQRMIGIKGPRGAGKTTLMLQHLKYDLKDMVSKALYVTADHTWFL